MLAARTFLRRYSNAPKSYFDFFPKSFPHGGPPRDLFSVNARTLRREFRNLQSEHHPDVAIRSRSESAENWSGAETDDNLSALINKAYTTLRNPYTRAAYILQEHHPDHLDIAQDDVAKETISRLQELSPEYSVEYKQLLLTVLEVHEALEMAASEADLEVLEAENESRIQETSDCIETLLQENPIRWEAVVIEAIRMKYWVNIANGIKEWEPGKPVHLTH